MKYPKIYMAVLFIFGTYLLALNYNLFLVPNNIVFGGVSGIAILIKQVFNVSPSLFVLIANIIILILSFIFLGVKKSLKSAFGSILYPLFISLTENFNDTIMITSDNTFFYLIIACITYGLASAMINKSDYTTGGSNIIMQILSKYGNVPLGKSSTIINGAIILIGGFNFGLSKVVYAFIATIITEKLTDKMMFGISSTKMILYTSDNHNKINDIVKKELNIGVTKIMIEHNGNKQKSYMILAPTPYYEIIKKIIFANDINAEVIVNDCYEVLNGTKKDNYFTLIEY